jgi:hypothetical protein
MVEKKQSVQGLILKYNGPFSVEDFYKEVEKWIQEKGMQKDLKRKTEDVTSKGKNIEWVIEAWKNPVRAVKQEVRMKALFNDVKEVKKKKNGKTLRFNEGKVLIDIDGWVETSLTGRVSHVNPLYAFFRTLYDKYIWNIGTNVTEANESPVNEYCYDLHKRLKAFFELYKIKVS